MVIAFAFLLGALLLGFFALILLIVLFALGNARFKYQPALTDHRPLLLESFALWGPAYLLLGFLIRRWSGAHNVLLFEAVFVAVTILIALWPMFRGMPWPELKNALGWHTGAGVFTEIGAGILGYIAGLPILAIALLITFALARATHANPSHPISQEITGDMSISKILELLAAISIGAPFLEETMFRGALYGHLRRRWRPWLSAGVTAFLFAAIHPQGWAAIPVLGSIAIVLTLLREWRGSLLASMTAHCINNGAVLLLIVTVLK